MPMRLPGTQPLKIRVIGFQLRSWIDPARFPPGAPTSIPLAPRKERRVPGVTRLLSRTAAGVRVNALRCVLILVGHCENPASASTSPEASARRSASF